MLHPFEGGRFILRGELDEATRAELFELREHGRSPRATTRRSPPGTGSRSRRSPSAAGCSTGADWVDAAGALGEFLLGPLSTADGRLHRTWRDGVAKGTGYLEDYADVANGLLELHAATGELRWLEEAHRLARLAVELFPTTENGGFFQTPADGEQLVVRRKNFDDQPAPSGNSMLAYVLLRLARIYGDDELEEKAPRRVQARSSAGSRTCRSSFGWGLVGVDLYLSPRREIAIVGPADSEVARRRFAAGSRTR